LPIGRGGKWGPLYLGREVKEMDVFFGGRDKFWGEGETVER
jgi:hypothetical protein